MGHRAKARRRPVAALAVQAEVSEQECCAKADEALFFRRAEDGELFECLPPSSKDRGNTTLLSNRRKKDFDALEVRAIDFGKPGAE